MAHKKDAEIRAMMAEVAVRKRAGLPPLEVEHAVTESGVKRIRATKDEAADAIDELADWTAKRPECWRCTGRRAADRRRRIAGCAGAYSRSHVRQGGSAPLKSWPDGYRGMRREAHERQPARRVATGDADRCGQCRT